MDMVQFLLLLSAALGLLSVARLSLSLLRAAYRYFLRRPRNLRSRYGAWALVTGCTDSIGRALALALARAGLDLVLVGRSPAKLAAVAAAAAAARPGVLVRSVVLDLAGEGTGRAVREAVEGLDVGVLVNCAGTMGAGSAELFHEAREEEWAAAARVNVEATTEVARVVLEGMLERGRGAVVNVGSGSSAAVPSYPFYAVYAATKAYIDQFSKCLHLEYKNKGIDVQCQVPLFVDTKMIKSFVKVDRSSIFTASPEGYARAAVRWIGYEAQCVPYFPHFLQCCLYSILPASVLNYAMFKANMANRKAICTE